MKIYSIEKNRFGFITNKNTNTISNVLLKLGNITNDRIAINFKNKGRWVYQNATIR